MDEETTGMLGVVVVAYDSAGVIEACLDSLLASRGVDLRIVVVDNASPDNTVERVRGWARARSIGLGAWPAGEKAVSTDVRSHPVTLIQAPRNLGFAGGVNLGLRALLADPAIGLFWLVNPDGAATPDTAVTYLRAARDVGAFALMGGRTLYAEAPNRIQSDGGRINRWTGVCRNVNRGLAPKDAVPPEPTGLDFISGANLVASRTFVERAGLMREDYFLYYEEVDWAFRRGDLPLATCPEALIYHEGGTAIGSGSATRRASGFANYFNYRSRMRFLRRFNPRALPLAYGYALAKAIQLVLLGARSEAAGVFRALHGLRPPAEVRRRLSPEALALALDESRRQQ